LLVYTKKCVLFCDSKHLISTGEVYINKGKLEDLVSDIISSTELSLTIRSASAQSICFDPLLRKCGRMEITQSQKIACVGLTSADANQKSWIVFQNLLKKHTREVFSLSTIAGNLKVFQFQNLKLALLIFFAAIIIQTRSNLYY
jgi:hypothetical protein